MIVIPAIDLRDGRCVRLVQGDFGRELVYDEDPVRVARRWRERGAPLVHVVDLDGAKEGYPVQLDLVKQIVDAVAGLPVQLGGGLRALDHLEAAFAAGVARVVIGTAAVEHPEVVEQAVERFGPEQVVLGVDARGGRVAVHGWLDVTEVPAEDVVLAGKAFGVTRVVYTDIERDGTLTAPNITAVAAIARLGVRVIASGGIASRAHLEQLAVVPGVEGAIVGRALYDGSLEIRDPAEWYIGARPGGRQG